MAFMTRANKRQMDCFKTMKAHSINNHAMKWMEQTTNGCPYPLATMQLTLSTVTFYVQSIQQGNSSNVRSFMPRTCPVSTEANHIRSVITQAAGIRPHYNLYMMDNVLRTSQPMKTINMDKPIFFDWFKCTFHALSNNQEQSLRRIAKQT